MVLMLDFDGVMHPDQVFRLKNRGIVLNTSDLPLEYANHALFCYAPALIEILTDFPVVRIVLSTSWVPTLGFSRALKRLPAPLHERVIGSTFHSRLTPFWERKTRFEQIIEHVGRGSLGANWIALDDDGEGWPDGRQSHLVHCDPLRGIGDLAAQAELREKLAGLRK